jgi:hypothetical protein
MNTLERATLNFRIGEILHWAFVSIRNSTYPLLPDEVDERDRINDLADLLHNLPRYIVGSDEHAIDSVEQLRSTVVQHVSRFHPTIDPEQHRMVRFLDMDESELFKQESLASVGQYTVL